MEAAVYSFVFVYGTLKQGQPNHHWLTNAENGHAEFVGTGKTKEAYPLVIASSYNIPFLLDLVGTGKNVQGEIYRVDQKMLQKLDILERHPSFYVRREVEVIPDGEISEKVIRCWTYLLPSFLPHVLEKPHLDSYSSSGAHGLGYVSPHLRDPSHDHRQEVRFL